MAETKDLFSRLKKLFSTDVIIRNIGGKRLAVIDTDQIEYATDRNSLRDRFNRLRSSSYNLHNRDMSLSYQAARLELFRDYDVMDMDPILSAALDAYCDNVCVPSEFGKILTITSNDENIKKILENLFYDILNVEFNLWSWTRNLCKYGDLFLKLELSPEYGIYVVRPLSAYEVTRVEGSDPKNINYVKFQHDGLGGGAEYENFEMAHFRLISDSNFLPYGKSMLEGARRVWKQLSLMEDAMLIHRIVRAPEKRIFKIDVGNIPPNEIDTFMKKIMDGVKKTPYIDERTGDYNLRYNLNNMLEDFYLPVRGGDSGTSIDTLPGMEFTGIDDLEYIKNKMMAALKIPKAFLGFDEAVGGKGTLAAEDVRFSHTITRIQRIIVSELTKIAVVHLYIQGYKDASLVDFELSMSNPSTVFEQEKLAIWQDKVNLAKDMSESKLFSRDWIYKNVWNMSKDDIETLNDDIIKDQKQTWRMTQIEDEGNDPAKSNQHVDDEGRAQDHGGGGPEGGGAEDVGLPELPDLKEEIDHESKINEVDDKMAEDLKKEKHLEALAELKAKELEETKERDQTGNKEKYQDVTTKLRGEDPLGKLVGHEKTTSNPISHKYKGGSALSLDEKKKIASRGPAPSSLDEELKRLKLALSAKFGITGAGKVVLTESPKSMLDEANLKTE
jgi:hypothetical protein